MTSLNTRYSAARPLPQRPSVAAPYTVPATSATGPAPNAPLLLPPPRHTGGKAAGGGGARIEVLEHASSTATELVLDLHLPGAKAGDQAHLAFYQAVANHIWHRCPQAGIRPKQGPDGQGLMVIDRPQDLTGQAIDRAVGEVATSVAFIQHIGGDLTHICQWIQDQPKIVEDLDQVFGGQTSPFEVAAAAARLAEQFAAAGRPDLERLTLDTALLMASRQSDLEAARALLDAGAEIDAADANGWTPLMHACKSGNAKLATLLMSNGAAIEGRQKSGMTPLMAACHWGHAALASMSTARTRTA